MGDLSTVERRQVMVARALAGNVRMLVLDEPTASLSPREVDEVLRLARAMRDAGAAVIYVSHRLDEVLALVDRVVVLRDGRNVINEPRDKVDLPFLVSAISGRQRFAGGFAEVAEVAETIAHTHEPRTSEPVLVVDDITDGWKFSGISFEVHAGEVLGLGGLVGAGRTEVVGALVGDRPITGGSVTWRGAPVSFASPGDALKAGIVLLPEERRSQGLIAEYGVRENATLSTLSNYRFIGALSLLSIRKERAAVTPLVHALRIKTSGLDTPVRTLSGGTQQKVVTARALLSDASLIIMDEPTAGIDVDAKEEIYELIEELKAEGKAIIVICSEFAELERLSDRVVVLSGGRQSGTLEGEAVHEDDITRLCYLDLSTSGSPS
jgi:ribose transport system ATP-binding protein